MSTLLFVYGTLKEGFPNHALNTGRRVGGTYRTKLPYPFYVVRLPNEDRAPWLINSPGAGHRVSGQVFEVDSAALQAMDSFEEVGLASGYVRVEIELEDTIGAQTLLRAYAYMKHEHQLVECLSTEGPFDEFTSELAAGYRLAAATVSRVNRCSPGA